MLGESRRRVLRASVSVIAGSTGRSRCACRSRISGGLELKLTILGGAAALLLTALPGVALAEDLTFTLTNNSSYAVKSLFTSPADVDTWEEDVFADKYLPAGNFVDVTIGDGREQCVYDMTLYEGVTHGFFGLYRIVNKAMFAQGQLSRNLVAAFGG